MDGMAQDFHQLPKHTKPRYGGRENNVAISLAKNVVFNMESVLNDLKGIMGEITTIVDHIDTVTGSVNKNNKGGRNNRNLHSTKHKAGKSLYGKYSESELVNIDMDVSPEADNKSAAEPSQLAPINKVLNVTGFSHHQDCLSSKQQNKHTAVNINGDNRLEWKSTSKMLCLSKELNHIDTRSTGKMPHNGAIAIVYPTIINNLPATSKSGNTEISETPKSTTSINNFPAMSPKQTNKTSSIQKSIAAIDNKSQRQIFTKSEINLSSHLKTNYEMTTQDTVEEASKQEKEEQEHITFSMNMSILPSTQADQPLLTGAKEKQHPHSQFSRKVCANLEVVDEIFETSTAIEPVQLGMNCSRDVKTQRKNTISRTSDACVTSTGEVDLLKKHSLPCQNQDFMFKSPLMRHSSPKSVYYKVQRSPASIRSPNISHGCETKSYYYSTESDADSDSYVEYHDVRSITPDIDWSYLNLVGNGDTQHNMAVVADTDNKMCPVPASDMCNSLRVYSHQKNATVEALSEEIVTPSLLDAKEKFKMPYMRVHRYSITGNPVPIHLFCSEVSSFESVGYCGYYEALLDSVLENIAGFESFEEACDAIDNMEALNEAYASCDTEFEEDEWEIGMKSSSFQDAYSFPLSHKNQQEALHIEGLEYLDRNRNVLVANSCNPNRNVESDYLNTNLNTDWPRPSKIIEETLFKEKSKVTSSSAADYENQDSFKCSTTGKSHTDNDNRTMKIRSSNINQNLMFHQESIHSTQLCLNNEHVINTGISDPDTERSLNDAASCPTNSSPMSFSSSEMAYPSPETDPLEFVSEDDSLNSSQEDSVSLSSESGYDAKMFIHKAKLKRLRKEFFLSLYRKFDDAETEPVDNNGSVTSLDDISSLRQSLTKLEKNRDSASESESYLDNVTGYNKSINTWKEYALVDLQTDDLSDSASYICYENNAK